MKGLRRTACTTGAALALSAVPAGAAEPVATPQRPSLSSNTSTTARGLFELELGAGFSEDFAALPLFGKWGLTDALELDAGIDAVRWTGGPGDDDDTSIGDLLVGARWRSAAKLSRAGLAVAGLVKLPTAGDDGGSGELDASAIGIASLPLDDGRSLDLNLVWSALGQDRGGRLGQLQAIATLGIPLPARWSWFVEGAYQRTAGRDDGGFFDAGIAFAATPQAVLDVAAGTGWSDGYPDWSVAAGWTVLFTRGR